MSHGLYAPPRQLVMLLLLLHQRWLPGDVHGVDEQRVVVHPATVKHVDLDAMGVEQRHSARNSREKKERLRPCASITGGGGHLRVQRPAKPHGALVTYGWGVLGLGVEAADALHGAAGAAHALPNLRNRRKSAY